jgi:transcriptional regulator GlxA family with amidase domain
MENSKNELGNGRQKGGDPTAQASSTLGSGSVWSSAALLERFITGGLQRWQVLELEVYVDSRLDRNVSVAELSQVVSLRVSHFSRAFKKTFKVTPHNYVLRRRIAHAKNLLESTRVPLLEIALICGFSDQPHLCKAFKKFVDVTPATWRASRE